MMLEQVYRVQSTEGSLTSQLGAYSNINKALEVAEKAMRNKGATVIEWVFSYSNLDNTIRMYAEDEGLKIEVGIISWEVK